MPKKSEKELSDRIARESRLGAHLEKSADMLDTAKFLLNRKFPEDSVSRSYFAAFHALGAVLCSKGVFIQTDKQLFEGIKRTIMELEIFPHGFISKMRKFYADCIAADEAPKSIINEQTAHAYVQFADEIVLACKGYLKIE
jgi:uncharacterized protein (UPF0332 family)